jgi:hypothetical protein
VRGVAVVTTRRTNGGVLRHVKPFAGILARRRRQRVTRGRVSTDQEETMKFRALLAAAAFALSSGIAFANHCPVDMKEIDAALAKNPKLTPEQMAEVKKYRAEGEALHKAGKHQESVDTLAKAKKLLGI